MNFLILPASQQAELDAINATFTDRCCNYRATSDGTLLISDNGKTTDPYWSAFQSILSTLQPFSGIPVWPVSDSEQIS